MQEFQGRTAVITGGASGIGFAMARAFGAAGMQVMLADVEAPALETAVAELQSRQVRAEGLICDVSDRAAVARLAQAAQAQFGNVHILCNNAGVGGGGPVATASANTWDWVLGVNLHGVIHGLEAFLPAMLAHGEPGHIVNTASMAGLISPPGMAPYNATKMAVVGISEAMFVELQGENIGVSVLCPGWVRTGIADSSRNRPEDLADTAPAQTAQQEAMSEMIRGAIDAGMDPDRVAARVMEAIGDGELYILTHLDMRAAVEERFAAIGAAFDRAAASPALSD